MIIQCPFQSKSITPNVEVNLKFYTEDFLHFNLETRFMETS